jgi:hypothetical protein
MNISVTKREGRWMKHKIIRGKMSPNFGVELRVNFGKEIYTLPGILKILRKQHGNVCIK